MASRYIVDVRETVDVQYELITDRQDLVSIADGGNRKETDMTQWNARLLNAPKLRAIVELTDELADHCQSIANALADYEGADDLAGVERTEEREAFAEALTDLSLTWDQLKTLSEGTLT
jgi:hypothetical protein